MNLADRPTHHIDQRFADRLVTVIGGDVVDGDEHVDLDTDLLLTGFVDSLGVVMIVDWIERELDTEIDPGDVVLEHFRTIGAMLDYLRAR